MRRIPTVYTCSIPPNTRTNNRSLSGPTRRTSKPWCAGSKQTARNTASSCQTRIRTAWKRAEGFIISQSTSSNPKGGGASSAASVGARSPHHHRSKNGRFIFLARTWSMDRRRKSPLLRQRGHRRLQSHTPRVPSQSHHSEVSRSNDSGSQSVRSVMRWTRMMTFTRCSLAFGRNIAAAVACPIVRRHTGRVAEAEDTANQCLSSSLMQRTADPQAHVIATSYRH
mmetsp:Transcript_14622/g.40346  ORF Transcript_14622/g.40346 Transcript_14622/m.40346 type:complete len:225 (+) Transcript_14622:383-1057(+)